jgi:hypothetical protein
MFSYHLHIGVHPLLAIACILGSESEEVDCGTEATLEVDDVVVAEAEDDVAAGRTLVVASECL